VFTLCDIAILYQTFNFDRDSLENITLSVPVTYTEVEGAKSASLSLGLAYSKPIAKSSIALEKV